MDPEDMQARIEELEAERDNLQDQLDAANEELATTQRELRDLKEIADTARDYVRLAHELLEKGDF